MFAVIVNADDFGYHEAANRGIVRAFEQGLVSSTTLMANQPGFEEAVELAHALRIQDHVGVHLVLTSGTPLTDAMRRSARFCDSDGVFRGWREEGHVWRVSGPDREALIQELTAQLSRAREAGLPVTHVDSHHHAHNEWGVAGCVFAVARAMRVPGVRLARNCGPGIGVASSAYKRAFNGRLHRLGLARTRWFGGIGDWLHLRAVEGDDASLGDFELMTHPVLDEHGRIVDSYERGQELAPMLAPVTAEGTFISYTGARYEGVG